MARGLYVPVTEPHDNEAAPPVGRCPLGPPWARGVDADRQGDRRQPTYPGGVPGRRVAAPKLASRRLEWRCGRTHRRPWRRWRIKHGAQVASRITGSSFSVLCGRPRSGSQGGPTVAGAVEVADAKSPARDHGRVPAPRRGARVTARAAPARRPHRLSGALRADACVARLASAGAGTPGGTSSGVSSSDPTAPTRGAGRVRPSRVRVAEPW